MLPLRVVLYARISREKRTKDGQVIADPVSLDAQLERCRAYCFALGHTVVASYSETESAKDTDRDQFQAAFQFMQDGHADALCVLNLSRLTRNLHDFLHLLEDFFKPDAGFSLLSVEDHIDTGSATGRFIAKLIVGTYEWERETVSERALASVENRKERGLTYSRQRYGWKRVSEGGNMREVEDPHQQEVIALMGELRDSGCTLDAIVEEINARGERTVTGKKWKKGQVHRLLQETAR